MAIWRSANFRENPSVIRSVQSLGHLLPLQLPMLLRCCSCSSSCSSPTLRVPGLPSHSPLATKGRTSSSNFDQINQRYFLFCLFLLRLIIVMCNEVNKPNRPVWHRNTVFAGWLVSLMQWPSQSCLSKINFTLRYDLGVNTFYQIRYCQPEEHCKEQFRQEFMCRWEDNKVVLWSGLVKLYHIIDIYLITKFLCFPCSENIPKFLISYTNFQKGKDLRKLYFIITLVDRDLYCFL